MHSVFLMALLLPANQFVLSVYMMDLICCFLSGEVESFLSCVDSHIYPQQHKYKLPCILLVDVVCLSRNEID